MGRGRGGHGGTSGTAPSDPNQRILEAVWGRKDSSALVHDFCGNTPGPSRSVSSNETAKEAFCRFFTDDV